MIRSRLGKPTNGRALVLQGDSRGANTRNRLQGLTHVTRAILAGHARDRELSSSRRGARGRLRKGCWHRVAHCFLLAHYSPTDQQKTILQGCRRSSSRHWAAAWRATGKRAAHQESNFRSNSLPVLNASGRFKTPGLPKVPASWG